MDKFVYSLNEGSLGMDSLLGSKGATLADMIGMGLPIPYGIVVTSEACRKYYEDGDSFISEIKDEIFERLADLEKVAGMKFGDPADPLILSLRATSKLSMPGLMPTILDLGLNDDTVIGLARKFGNMKMAYDCYRRFIRMYGRVVLGIDRDIFDRVFLEHTGSKKQDSINKLSTENVMQLAEDCKKIITDETGKEFPQNVNEQLMETIKAMFDSWYNHKAIVYRRINHISSDDGTAVCIQRMIFGNLKADSGAGAVFTRDPISGEKGMCGEYMPDAQGEDLAYGFRTPRPIEDLRDGHEDIYNDLVKISDILENHYADVQNIEFTVEAGKLYIMQTKSANRTAMSAVKTAVDMVEEGLITKDEALMRVKPRQMMKLLERSFSEEGLDAATPIAQGVPSSPGAAYGRICFSSADAQDIVASGEHAVLVRREISPEDISGMFVAEGILTEEGGITSHASAIARSFGTCCVTGADIIVDEARKKVRTDSGVLGEHDIISIDGVTGRVYKGMIDIEEPKIAGDIETLLDWVDKERDLYVYANVDNLRDAELALRFGAEGIGLCRTERMFLNDGMIYSLWKLLLADSPEGRREALSDMHIFLSDKLKDFYRIMKDKPVVIGLLDPPIHEYIPKTESDMKIMARKTGMPFKTIRHRVHEVSEFNPMLGERGARLLIKRPDIVKMQAEAVIESAAAIQDELDIEIVPHVMVPFICDVDEFKVIKEMLIRSFETIFSSIGKTLDYRIGAMIEVPRAALTADKIAEEADFISFGTNDLTQLTYGFSRDDSTSVIFEYKVRNVIDFDPFQTIDREGVGVLVERAAELAKSVKGNIRLGICGEQAADPYTINFISRLGFHHISCSAYMIPVARLSAGRVAINMKHETEDKE